MLTNSSSSGSTVCFVRHVDSEDKVYFTLSRKRMPWCEKETQ